MKRLVVSLLFIVLFFVSVPITRASASGSIATGAYRSSSSSQHRRRYRRYRGPVRAITASVGAMARCRDGTYSFSQHRRGTCSYHGGAAKWL